MKFNVNVDAFLKAIKGLKQASSDSNYHPWISSVEIFVANESVVLSTSNNRSKLRLSLEVEDLVKPAYPFYVNVFKLTKALTSVPAKKAIQVEANESNLLISYDKTKIKLPTVDIDDYSVNFVHDSMTPTVEFALDAAKLKEALFFLKKSVSKDSNTAIGGVNFKAVGSKFELATTDGSVLSIYEAPISGTHDFSFIVYFNELLYLDLFLENTKEAQVSFKYDPTLKAVLVEYGNLVSQFNVMDAAYPKYENIVPKSQNLGKYHYELQFNKKVFKESLKSSIPFVSERTKIVHIVVRDESVFLKGKTDDLAYEGELDASVLCLSGKEFTIGFNYAFLNDFLATVTADTFTLKTNGWLAPTLFVDDAGLHKTRLIMPVQAEWKE